MNRDHLLFYEHDTRLPKVCDKVYGTVVVSAEGQIAVLYWARSEGFGIPLVLLDWDLMTFGSVAWDRVDEAIKGFCLMCGARSGSIGLFVEAPALAHQLNGQGFRAIEVPAVISNSAYWEGLNFAAAAHINAGSVKVTQASREKALSASVGDDVLNRGVFKPLAPDYRLGPRDDTDASVPAWLYGIVLGLDETAAREIAKAKKAPPSGNSRR